MLSADDVRELREELGAFKLETVQRLARIETQLEALVNQQNRKSPPGDGSSTTALGRVSVGLVEVLRLLAAAAIAWVAAKSTGGQL